MLEYNKKNKAKSLDQQALQLKELINEGLIGDVLMTQAHFNMNPDITEDHRLLNPELGGGALLDVGIYPISFARLIMGMPNAVHSHAQIGETGVDLQAGMLFEYDDGKSAILSCGIQGAMPTNAIVKGTKGYIEIPSTFWNATELVIHVKDELSRTLEVQYESTGLNYEAQEVMDCIRAGKTESDLMPLDLSLKTMQLMDDLREKWGVTYANDQRNS